MEKFQIGLPQDDHGLESAKLKLAFLKENLQFKSFYEDLVENVDFSYEGEKVPIEGSFDYRYQLQFLEKIEKEPTSLRLYFENLGFRPENITGFLLSNKVSFYEILLLLDPKKDLSEILPEFRSPDSIQKILHIMFQSPGICELRNTGGLLSRWFKRNPSRSPYQIQPYERIYLVDLRKKKAQLLREFERYIDKELEIQKKTTRKKQDDPWGYDIWAPENGRLRKEAWDHLKVWRLRKKRKSFPEIARELKLTEDTTKKCFYRAYHLTQGRPYDPEALREMQRVRKSELEKTCGTCPKLGSCTDPCPDMLAYVNQDMLKYSREKLLKEDSDSFKDYLFQENPSSNLY